MRVSPILRLLAPLLLACAGPPPSGPGTASPVTGREAGGGARAVPGFQNPEDLAPLPGGEALLVSEYGGLEGDEPGQLSLYVLATDERRELFRGGDMTRRPLRAWSDPACTGPPSAEFSPHGIDLVRRRDGKLQLLVVQHGGREAIEVFEVAGAGSAWSLTWRGCMPAPEDAWLNDVVGLRDGSLLTTHMMSRSGGSEQLAQPPASPTGQVYAWTPDVGFAEVPGTRGMLPNGIEVSPDEKTLFLNLSLESLVRRIDRASGEASGAAQVAYPDNSTWTPDGKRLLVASLRLASPDEFERCRNLSEGAGCPLPFAIVAVDPETLASEDVYVSDGSPMGGGTVGLQVGDELFVGTFAGDRLLRVKLR